MSERPRPNIDTVREVLDDRDDEIEGADETAGVDEADGDEESEEA